MKKKLMSKFRRRQMFVINSGKAVIMPCQLDGQSNFSGSMAVAVVALTLSQSFGATAVVVEEGKEKNKTE